MGLFSSKYVHHVGTTIQRVVKEDDVKNPLSLSIVESNLTKVDLVDNLLETAIHSLPIKSNNYYSYVNTNYPQKMPSGKSVVDTRFYDAVAPLVLSAHPNGNIEYVRFGPMNAFHEAWSTLVQDYGLDTTNGKVVAYSTVTHDFIVDYIFIELPKALKTVLTNWDFDDWFKRLRQSGLGYWLSDSTVIYSYDGKGVSFTNTIVPKVVVVGKMKPIKPPEKQEDLPKIDEVRTNEFNLSKINNRKEYYQVFLSQSIGDKIFGAFYTYEYGSSGIPQLDTVLSADPPAQNLGFFYPNLYYRVNKQKITEPEYPKIAYQIGIKYNDISAGVHGNPDIADVDTVAFNIAINADSTNELEAAYLFDFFAKIHTKQASTSITSSNYLEDWYPARPSPNLSNPKKAILINDDKMKSALTFEKVTMTSYAEAKYPVGRGASGKGSETRSYTAVDKDSEGNLIESVKRYDINYRYYRKQVSLSIWKEVRVYDLAMVYTIAGEYTNTVGDELKEICLVPIDKVILDTYQFQDKNELLTRGFHFIFNSHVIQKLKWYQQGWFADLLMIIAVVIFIYTGMEFISGLMAAAEISMLAAIQFVAMGILKSVATAIAVRLFVRVVGEELAFLAALVAFAAGMLDESILMMDPKTLLNLATGIFKGIGGFVKDQFDSLQKEIESWTELSSSLDKQLQTAEDLLKVEYNPIGTILAGERPDQFLYRTTVFATTGYQELSTVSTFVDRSLVLPQ